MGFRVYSFTKIQINHYKFSEDFGSGIFTDFRKNDKQSELLVDFPRDEQANILYSEFENLPFTHICLKDGWLIDALLWKTASPGYFDGFTQEDWMKHFGIFFDSETEYYHTTNKIWEEYLA
jgi:hypothetical protein